MNAPEPASRKRPESGYAPTRCRACYLKREAEQRRARTPTRHRHICQDCGAVRLLEDRLDSKWAPKICRARHTRRQGELMHGMFRRKEASG